MHQSDRVVQVVLRVLFVRVHLVLLARWDQLILLFLLDLGVPEVLEDQAVLEILLVLSKSMAADMADKDLYFDNY